MFQVKKLCAVFVAMTTCFAPAVARPIILDCEAVQIRGLNDEWRKVDQVEIDETSSTITFAEKRTLGTVDELAWMYGNTKDAVSYDRIAFERYEGTVRIAAIRVGSPTAIWVDMKSVRLVSLNKFSFDLAEFTCQPRQR
jgi:hypothetical protein